MSELARRRSARDLWISRSHLWAAGVLVVSLLVISYGIGFFTGRSIETVGGLNDEELVLDAANRESLIELLERIESSGVAGDGLASLTFPEQLQTETTENSWVDEGQEPNDITAQVRSGPVSSGGVVIAVTGMEATDKPALLAMALIEDGFAIRGDFDQRQWRELELVGFRRFT